jgi:hypothetical protein
MLPRLVPVGATFPGLAQLHVRADHAHLAQGSEAGTEDADRLLLIECQNLVNVRVEIRTHDAPLSLPEAHTRQFFAILSHPGAANRARLGTRTARKNLSFMSSVSRICDFLARRF